MKVSQKIRNIVRLAEEKFEVNRSHLNDGINVGIYPEEFGEGWQVWIARPTVRQLEALDMDDDFLDTHKSILFYEYDTHCFVRGDSLSEALDNLYESVESIEIEKTHSIPLYPEQK